MEDGKRKCKREKVCTSPVFPLSLSRSFSPISVPFLPHTFFPADYGPQQRCKSEGPRITRSGLAKFSMRSGWERHGSGADRDFILEVTLVISMWKGECKKEKKKEKRRKKKRGEKRKEKEKRIVRRNFRCARTGENVVRVRIGILFRNLHWSLVCRKEKEIRKRQKKRREEKKKKGEEEKKKRRKEKKKRKD
jgi:hypothetical protein